MKKIIVITGPTGVGKTKYSINLAKKFNGEIINADASQVYKKLNIGTAKIKYNKTEGIKHHLLDIVEPEADFSIKEYQDLGRGLIDKIETPFIVGGSGLYINALITNYKLDSSPRSEGEYLQYSNEQLHEILASLDEKAAKKIHANNRRRVLRYIEIAKEKGRVAPEKPASLYNELTLCLIRERKVLYQRINRRCDEMFAEGWVEECKKLREESIDLSKLKDIGYRDIGKYLEGDLTLDEVKEKIKQQQRRYAKRQMTWFKNKMTCIFIDVDKTPYQEIENLIYKFLNEK